MSGIPSTISVMRPKVYLETTVPSYLTAWTSRDLVMAAHQQITSEWWNSRRSHFDLFVPLLVLQEAAVGDPDAATRRMNFLRDIPTLAVSEAAIELAQELARRLPLPERASLDALHIGVATVSGMNYLLTWNCKHIANAAYQPRIGLICRDLGYKPPVICTPKALSWRNRLMQPDPIVEEVRAAREAYGRRFGFDLRAILRDLQEQERTSGRELVSFPPRRPEPAQPVAAGGRRGPCP